MSLNYDLSNIKDRDTRFPDRDDKGNLDPIIESLIFASIPCGFTDINEDNYREVWVRVNLYQQAVGSFFNKIGPDNELQPLFVKKVDVHDAIGLRTNATRLTRARFLNGLYSLFERIS